VNYAYDLIIMNK